MKKILVVMGFAACLGACSSANPTIATPNQVVLAVNAYDAAVATAKNYLALGVCSAVVNAPCRTLAMSTAIVSAVLSGRAAKNSLVADLQANTTIPITLFQTLTAAAATINQLNAQ